MDDARRGDDDGAAPLPVHPFFAKREPPVPGGPKRSLRGQQLPPGWVALGDSCLHKAMGDVPLDCPRVLGFDFDNTLVNRHNNDIMFASVPDKLRKAAMAPAEQRYRIVVFSNEALDHISNFENALVKKLKRIEAFAQSVGVPIEFFLATRYDEYHKSTSEDAARGRQGGIKMWEEMARMAVPSGAVDLKQVCIPSALYLTQARR